MANVFSLLCHEADGLPITDVELQLSPPGIGWLLLDKILRTKKGVSWAHHPPPRNIFNEEHWRRDRLAQQSGRRVEHP